MSGAVECSRCRRLQPPGDVVTSIVVRTRQDQVVVPGHYDVVPSPGPGGYTRPAGAVWVPERVEWRTSRYDVAIFADGHEEQPPEAGDRAWAAGRNICRACRDEFVTLANMRQWIVGRQTRLRAELDELLRNEPLKSGAAWTDRLAGRRRAERLARQRGERARWEARVSGLRETLAELDREDRRLLGL